MSSVTKCEDYKKAPFNENECKAIIPSDDKYKCDVSKDSNVKDICISELKSCNEFSSSSTSNCIDLIAEDEQRCFFYTIKEQNRDNSYCEAFYDDCSKITDEVVCNKNIPSNNLKKCQWKSNAFTTVDRPV